MNNTKDIQKGHETKEKEIIRSILNFIYGLSICLRVCIDFLIVIVNTYNVILKVKKIKIHTLRMQ